MNNRKFDDIGTAEVFVTVASIKLAVLKNQFMENKNLNRLRKKQKEK
jgi:hypothetical protein